MADVDEKTVELVAKRICLADMGGDEDLANHPRIGYAWSFKRDKYLALARAAIAVLPSEATALRDRVKVLEGALQLIANAIHPRFRTEDDIDLLYANEKAFGQCIDIARAALTEPTDEP